MALLNKEDGSYLMVDMSSSYINVNGAYVGMITYNNKEERTKDKELIKLIPELIQNIEEFISLNAKEEYSEEDAYLLNKIDAAYFFLANKNDILYKIEGSENFPINETLRDFLISLGVHAHLIDNPVIIVNTFELWIGEEFLKDFTAENFYIKLKEFLKETNGEDYYENI